VDGPVTNEVFMHKILYIESSDSQRDRLTRLLAKHEFAVVGIRRFEEAISLMKSVAEDKQYDAVILSWPANAQTSTDEFLAALSEPDLAGLPVLVIAHEADAAKLTWVSGRARTAFLLWPDHQDAPQSLNKLLAGPSSKSRIRVEGEEPIHVLLVDDSSTSRSNFGKLLNSAGYRTQTASTAAQALEKIQQVEFDIAIIEYFMPDKNGDELVRQLKTQSPTLKCIILSSTYLDSVITDSLEAGAVECLLKNESDELFLTRIGVVSRTVQMTRHLEQERQRLAGILASVGDGVYGVDTSGLITFINPAVKEILGYQDDSEIIAKHPSEVFQRGYEEANTAQKVTCLVEQAIEDGNARQAVETTFMRTDGSPIEVELTILPLTIAEQRKGAVVAFRDISGHKRLQQELQWHSSHDQLTGLPNRKSFELTLEQEVNRLKRSQEISALIYIDIDRFKYINDTIGHAAGDRLLVEIGKLIQSQLRKTDLLSRIGGDEFAILMRNVKQDSLHQVAEKIRLVLEGYTFKNDERDYQVNGSIGVAPIDMETVSAGSVLSNADLACHIAKGKGRNQSHVYHQHTEDKIAMDLDLGWSIRLTNALDDNDFVLYYQPIVALDTIDTDHLPEKSGQLWSHIKSQPNHDVFYEVLIRLKNPNDKLIMPMEFLPTAERFNLMKRIDTWVVKESLQQLAMNHRSGNLVKLSLNLSGQSIDDLDILQLLQEGIDHHSLLPSDILLEITESCAINQLDAAHHFINAMKELGCYFALDDFGTGYSSFSHLKNLAVDIVKIDGQFVRNIATDPMDLAIVNSVVNIAKSQGKKTIAEFVENAESLRLLKEAGVDYVQGYYISKPMDSLPVLEDICNTSLVV
jgi:diguanylate cyclase (GGDEF)-like protein/PAS domain S-box-containing protein